MRSMTGHGRGTAESQGRRVTVEIRSVNHRFFELKLRAARIHPSVEDRIVKAVRARVERGAFVVTLHDEGGVGAARARADLPLARSIAAALEELRVGLGLTAPVELALIAAQSGVLAVGDADDDPDAVFTAIAPALDRALDQLVKMRCAEGAALARELASRADRLRDLAGSLFVAAAGAPAEHSARLRERLDRLLASAGVTSDEARLQQEVAILCDRGDVTEELVRLGSHLDQVDTLLVATEPVGRRLDFLVQELGREVNTVGSKSSSAALTRLVVEAKSELEKLREQLQNVE